MSPHIHRRRSKSPDPRTITPYPMLLTASRGASTVDNLANAGRNFRELYGANMAIRGRDFFFQLIGR